MINRFLIFFIFFIFFTFNIYALDCEKPKMPSDNEWNSWLTDIKKEAKELGISQNTISIHLNEVQPQSKIIMRDRCQPASTMTLDEYLFYTITKDKIYIGKNFIKKHRDLLEDIGSYFKIQPRFIVAVLGMESYYGRNQGNINSIIAITTLAFDRRRSNFYKKQLFAALEILDKNLVPNGELIGSWGGAVGMTQMIPTTFLETAYDWDGNGIDIWNSYADAFASTANYLTSLDNNPWSSDSTWGREVLPPKNFASIVETFKQDNPKGCSAVKSRSIPKTLKEWSDLNFTNINGDPLPIRNDLESRLIMPDGIDGRMFIVYPNYKNILYYNCSSYYAVSVGILSDKISN